MYVLVSIIQFAMSAIQNVDVLRGTAHTIHRGATFAYDLSCLSQGLSKGSRKCTLEEISLLHYFLKSCFPQDAATVFSGGFLVDMATEKHFILWLSALEAGS